MGSRIACRMISLNFLPDDESLKKYFENRDLMKVSIVVVNNLDCRVGRPDSPDCMSACRFSHWSVQVVGETLSRKIFRNVNISDCQIFYHFVMKVTKFPMSFDEIK